MPSDNNLSASFPAPDQLEGKRMWNVYVNSETEPRFSVSSLDEIIYGEDRDHSLEPLTLAEGVLAIQYHVLMVAGMSFERLRLSRFANAAYDKAIAIDNERWQVRDEFLDSLSD